MPYCPECKGEYRDGFSRCGRCEVDLVDALELEPKIKEPPKVKPQPRLSSEVPLITVDDIVELSYITSLLEIDDIPYRVMERGVGQYLRIYFGTSYMGRTIYVDKKNYDKAAKIAASSVASGDIDNK